MTVASKRLLLPIQEGIVDAMLGSAMCPPDVERSPVGERTGIFLRLSWAANLPARSAPVAAKQEYGQADRGKYEDWHYADDRDSGHDFPSVGERSQAGWRA